VGALDGTAARLQALVPGFPDTYAVETTVPVGPGWSALDAVPIAALCAAARERGNPHRLASVAAMSVGGAVIHAVLGRVTAAIVLERRAWDLAAAGLVVHQAPQGHIDRVALRAPVAWVLPDDPAAGSAGVRVLPDAPTLIGAVAAGAVGTLGPLLDAVRAATRFGRVPLWNAAADTVRTTATFVPLYAGHDPRPGRALADALLDGMIAQGAPIRGRGIDEPLAGRPERVPVRAACCLWFRTDPPVPRPSDAYCTTCPLLDPAERAARYRAFLATVSSADR